MPEVVVTALPVVVGWFAHVTPPSVQEPPSWRICSVRPPAADFAYMRSVALSTEQPVGIVGRLNRTSARRLPPLLDITLRVESEPLFDEVLPESIQASAFAVSVCWVPQLTVVLWIVHV